MPVDLSVIIPLHNRLDLSRAMLASLQATLPAGLTHEIILVDNASNDGTREWLGHIAQPPMKPLFLPSNLGYAGANNQGALHATGTFLALLNSDLVLLPGWLEPMLDAVQRPGIGIAGNIQLSVRSRQIDHAGIIFDQGGQPRHFRPSSNVLAANAVIETPAVTGACLLIKRSLFGEMRGFDEGYVNGYEDVDLCLRAREAGQRCAVAAHSGAYHHIGASGNRSPSEASNESRFRDRWGKVARELGRNGEPVLKVTSNNATWPFDRDAYATLQAFHPTAEGHSEIASTAHLYPTGRWTTVTVPLGQGITREGHALRLDPCDFPASVHLTEFKLREIKSDETVWTASQADLPKLFHLAGSALARVGQSAGLVIESNGRDPQMQLQANAVPRALTRRQDLAAEIRIMTEIPGRVRTLVRVAVDLTRLGQGGQNGGIKPFVFDFLQWIATAHGDEVAFVYFTKSSLVPEVEAFRRNTDKHICVGESEGIAAPVGPVRRAGLEWAPEIAGDWRKSWPVDILYAPLGLSAFCRPGLPWISLIADTLHRDRPDALPADENAYRDQWMAESVATADAIQCLSQFGLRRLARHFHASDRKLFVTHYGLPKEGVNSLLSVASEIPAGAPYFLYPAHDWPHKNHQTLLEAYATYRRNEGADAWDLILTGHFDRIEHWKNRASALGLDSHCHVLGHVAPKSFASVFRRAGALIFPSLYEGFGIPVLEAMAVGVPVACSDVASLPEVAGDAALYFDPADSAKIAHAMSRLSSDASLRRRLTEAGRKRAEDFSLEREAGRLADRFLCLAR